jgi:hypothetical protein
LWQGSVIRDRNTFLQVQPDEVFEPPPSRPSSDPTSASSRSASSESSGGTLLGLGVPAPSPQRGPSENHVQCSSEPSSSSSSHVWANAAATRRGEQSTGSRVIASGAARGDEDEDKDVSAHGAGRKTALAAAAVDKDKKREHRPQQLGERAPPWDECPLDENDKLPSMGSALHSSFGCKPCKHMPNCHHGYSCRFCHFPNHGEGFHRYRMRPCKSKRDRYKALVERTFDQIDRRPDSFDPEQLDLPPSVASNQEVMSKFMTRVRNRMGMEEGGDAESSVGAKPSSSHASDSTKLSL